MRIEHALAWSPGPFGGSTRSSKRREAATRKGVMGAGQKVKAKREGLVNGLYIGWNLGMWWVWLIFAITFFADTRVCVLTH